MKVSCICPTYGRCPYDQFMLEEVLYWFNAQTYTNKELIIVNDCPHQTLTTDVAGVEIHNLSIRFATLGQKYNYAISVSSGKLIFPFEDDDISLPNRLSRGVAQLGDSITDGYYKPVGAWFQNGSEAKLSTCVLNNVFHNQSCYKRECWEKTPYPSVTGPQDAQMDSLLRSYYGIKTPILQPKDYVYVYRWQHGSGVQPNLSGFGTPQQAYDATPCVPGIFHLKPVMHTDYEKLARGIVYAGN